MAIFKNNYNSSEVKKAQKNYAIPSNEKIIGIITRPGLLGEADGMVFTADAFYVNMRHAKRMLGFYKRSNRIPYGDLAGCIVSYDDKSDSLWLHFPKSIWRIYAGDQKNKSGANLFAYLKSIQNKHLNSANADRKIYDELVSNTLKQAKTNLQRMGLDPVAAITEENRLKLHTLLYDDNLDVAIEAASLLAENYARLNSKSQYLEYILSFPSSIPDQIKHDLSVRFDCYISRFIAGVETPITVYSVEYLKRVYKQLKTVEKDSQQFLLFGLLSIRFLRREDISFCISSLKDEEQYSKRLVFYFLLNNNILSQKIFKELQDPNGKYKRKYGIRADGIYMSPLHYAMALGNEKAIIQLLSTKRYSSNYSFLENQELEDVLDYAVVAEYLYQNGRLNDNNITRWEILKGVDQNLQKMEKARKVLVGKSRISGVVSLCAGAAASVIQDQQGNQQRTFDNRYYDDNDLSEDYMSDDWPYDDYDLDEDYENDYGNHENGSCKSESITDEDLQQHYDNMRSLQQNSANMQVDFEAQIQLLDREIEEYVYRVFTAAEEKVKCLLKSKNSLIQYILAQYLHPELILTRLSTASDDNRLLQFGCFMIVPKSIAPIDEASDTVFADVTVEPIVRPFGDSWFSPSAHNDSNMLKVEYRSLAKKYHPDVSESTSAEVVFKEIRAEMEKIESELRER